MINGDNFCVSGTPDGEQTCTNVHKAARQCVHHVLGNLTSRLNFILGALTVLDNPSARSHCVATNQRHLIVEEEKFSVLLCVCFLWLTYSKRS